MRNNNGPFVAVAGIVVVIIVILGGISLAGFFNAKTHNDCVVNGKDRTSSTDSNGNRSSEMRVYTDNCGTFVVEDSLLKGKFNSADRYGGIKEGETYDFETIGYRVPFLSMFPNIIEVK